MEGGISPAARKLWFLVGVLCLVYLLIGMAPLFLSYYSESAADIAYRLGRTLCVQRPSKCLWFLNHYSALCGKCLGLYLGLLLISALAITKTSFRPHLLAGLAGLLVALLIFAQSIFRALYGGWEMPVLVNGGLGLISGSGLGFFCWSISGGRGKVSAKVHAVLWRVALVAVVLLHLIGFSAALAAEKKEPAPEKKVQVIRMFVPAGTPVILEVDVGFATDEVK